VLILYIFSQLSILIKCFILINHTLQGLNDTNPKHLSVNMEHYVVTAIVVYLWLVVLSYYQYLVEESHRGVYGKVPHRQ